jgi:transposase
MLAFMIILCFIVPMYIESIPNRNSPPCILLREDHREGKKVIKRTLANLSKLPAHIVEGLRVLTKGGSIGDLSGGFTITRSLPYGHVAAVLNVLKRLDMDKLVDSRASRRRDLIMAMIAARIIDPKSKLATARGLCEQTGINALAAGYNLGDISEDEIYEAMDWLAGRQANIEDKLAQRHLSEGTFVLYDLTSTWYEGRTCPLAKRGHSRDKKSGKLQIEFGLLCDVLGRPVSVEVFEGNTADPATVGSQIRKIRERFKLKRVVVVGDRGMLTDARIRDDLKGVEGLDWISALRGPAIRKLMENKDFTISLFDERDMAEITSPDFPGERLMVCRNPLLAQDRCRTREELLKATEKQLEAISQATRRQRDPLRGKKDIALRVGKVINKYKMAKHFKLTITDAHFKHERKDDQIQAEAALDGFYVVRTSVPAQTLTAQDTVSTYKRLSVVERAFRCIKTVDLKVRPIFHRLEKRVKAHIFLCTLAYYVEWEMRRILAPVLFDDQDHELAKSQRASVVAQAERSETAKRKAATKHTDDGTPVHSFRTLLADLATITKNQIQPNFPDAPPFYKITIPTPTQKVALDLLGITL